MNDRDPVKCVLSPELAQSSDLEEIQMDEAAFRWLMNGLKECLFFLFYVSTTFRGCNGN